MAEIEGDIQRRIMIAVQVEWPAAVVYRRNVGSAISRSGQLVRFGLPGQADIAAIIHGHAIEIECKSESGRQTNAQRAWQIAVQRAGGLYILARNAEQTIGRIRTWLSIG